MSKMRFSNRNLHFLLLFCYVAARETEKRKWKKAKQTCKIVFLKVVFQKWEKWKKWFYSKNCLTQFVSGREKKNAHLRVHCLGPKSSGPKTLKTRKHYKNRGFSRNCPKPKMALFLGKRCFLAWVKKCFLLIVVLKSCAFLKTLFL